MLQLLPSARYRNNQSKFITVRNLALFVVVATIITQPIFVSAQQFTPRVLIGGDTVAPTPPTSLVALPIAVDQITLEWGAATDNVAIAGYRVFRDAIQIATTTLTTFTDSGLTASTTYTYEVDAFDIFDIFSSSTPAVSTTTLAIPVVPPAPEVPENQSSGTTLVQVDEFIVTTTKSSATLQWQTSSNARYIVRWGRTTAYELGSVYGAEYLRTHQTNITGLEQSTRYFYEVTSVSNTGVTRVISRGEFFTKGVVSTGIVQNVAQLQVTHDDVDVRLRWNNPLATEFAAIRVVRSHLFYPQHPQDGALVYSGTGSFVLDSGALRDRSPQFYTVFVLDSTGRFSSGAVAVVYRSEDSSVVSNEPIPIEVVPLLPDGVATSSPIPDPVLFPMNVALTQFDATSYLHNPDSFSAADPLYVVIDAAALPRHLKSIVATLTHPSRENEVRSYLLKLNPEGTHYEVVIPAPGAAGKSTLTITLYNYDLATIQSMSNTIIFESSPALSVSMWQVSGVVTLMFLWILCISVLLRRYIFHLF